MRHLVIRLAGRLHLPIHIVLRVLPTLFAVGEHLAVAVTTVLVAPRCNSIERYDLAAFHSAVIAALIDTLARPISSDP